VDGTPDPLFGLMAITAGMGIWCGLSLFARPLPWFRTFVFVSYIGLAFLVLQAFVAAYDDLHDLGGNVIGTSQIELRSTMIFNIGFGFLSLLCAFAIYLSSRQRVKKGSETDSI
jgi:hypothetical protein